LRILYLADIRFPLERANGIQTFETCRALAARGHTVRLVVRRDTHRPARDPWQFYGAARVGGLSFETVPVAGPPALRRLRYLAAALLQSTRAESDVAFTRDLGLASMLTRLPRAVRPPVVYESHGDAATLSRELPRLIRGAPAPSPAKLARLERRERHVWRSADGYVTLTAAHLRELEARYGRRSLAAAVPDGARLDAGRTFTLPTPESGPLVGYAGHLYPWKGVDVLLQAIARLEAVRAVIVGGQPGETDRGRLEALAAALGVDARVRFTGWLPPAAVPAELARCHVLVLPNARTEISARYTSPLKLFEYLAAGRPIVASDLPALAEVLSNDRNAVLVPPGDEEALAAAVSGLLHDRARAERLARQAYSDAEQYSWDRRAERLEPVLHAAGARA